MFGQPCEYYWLKPHTLVLFSARPCLDSFKKSGSEPILTLQLEPTGLVQPYHSPKTGRGLVRNRFESVRHPHMDGLIRYQVKIEYPPHTPPFGPQIAILDDGGEPASLAARPEVSDLPEPAQPFGAGVHDEDDPGPHTKVLLFPLRQDETSPCSYYANMASATQIFFQKLEDAKSFAAKVTPLVRRRLAENSSGKPYDTASLVCRAEEVTLDNCRYLAFHDNHQDLLLYNRLWDLDVDTGKLELMYPAPLNAWALTPDRRHIAASVTTGYGSCALILFDLQERRTTRILPRQSTSTTANQSK